MRPMIEFTKPKRSSNKPKKIHNNSPFNTILFIALAVVMIYFLVKGFIWAWNTLGAWETL
ncbi:MAG: hypothetical protein GX921_05220 [Bacteroidales bacterium]|nr:hypothetical protein [Bacteroidales bacterium]